MYYVINKFMLNNPMFRGYDGQRVLQNMLTCITKHSNTVYNENNIVL